VTIAGPGQNKLAVDGNNASSVVSIPNSTSNVSISGLTLQHGNAGGQVMVAASSTPAS
jgi:hypothetical protein